MADARLRNFYLESRIKNASPGAILVLLYESLVENAEIAESEISAPAGSDARAQATLSIKICIDIITELASSLRHEVDPTLCSTLGGLYYFFTRQLAQALADSDPRKISAILPLARQLKEAWTKAHAISSKTQLAAATA
jgi:flagellar biosynthetic protein FliS